MKVFNYITVYKLMAREKEELRIDELLKSVYQNMPAYKEMKDKVEKSPVDVSLYLSLVHSLIEMKNYKMANLFSSVANILLLLKELSIDLEKDVVKIPILLLEAFTEGDFKKIGEVLDDSKRVERAIQSLLISYDHPKLKQLYDEIKEVREIIEEIVKDLFLQPDVREFDDGIYVDFKVGDAVNSEVHDATVEIIRDKDNKVVAIDIIFNEAKQ